MKKEQEPIYVSSNMKQIIQKHLASYATIHDGRHYVHLCEVIVLLRNIVGEERLKEHYGEEYDNIIKAFEEFQKACLHVTSFFSAITDKDYRESSFYHNRFYRYKRSLQYIPPIQTKIINLFLFLLSQTDLQDKTIPSAYLAQASKDIISFETEEEQKRKQTMFTRGEGEESTQ